ncbi:DUF3667 domain-containing protein [Pseudomarimonas arenosa]|uniref:DUF3667 domain-containing protein n=1 Tax=Pseudomarimonas arenosa TaxID=2774145 RepID=A0AAW3ZT91_9GAMM|nr:DUF3667 domain-containing protein [Pseudomarimonas arenosa]MBD8527744.1 DUF3667 domain-containing protein [Pseudomarimonas arenosa]
MPSFSHPAPPMPSSTPRPSHCQNCGADMYGDHCWQCGQPVKGLVRHFSSIIGDFLDSVFDLDARVPRTLGPLMFKPGYLSLQYFQGHRVRYVSPVRLFVFLCIISFFLLKFSFDADLSNKSDIASATTVAEAEAVRDRQSAALRATLERMKPEQPGRTQVERALQRTEREAEQRIAWLKQRDLALSNGLPVPPEPTDKPDIRFGDQPWHPTDNPLRFEAMPDGFNDMINRWVGRGQQNIERIQQDPGLLKDAFLENLPQTFIVLLPLFALLLKLTYVFKRRLYMEHLIVALHGHAFLCVAVLALAGLEALARAAGESSAVAALCRFLEVLLWIWMPVYLWLSQKRVYGQGWLMTSLKFGFVGMCYLLLLAIGVSASILISVVTL